MGAHIITIQIIQMLLVLVIVPVLGYYVLRTFVKIKVHSAVYGKDLNRYIEDKILEKQTQLNRNQDGK